MEQKPAEEAHKAADSYDDAELQLLKTVLEEGKLSEEEYRKCVAEMNASSDETCHEGWFTGTTAGLRCQDLSGEGLAADFDRFRLSLPYEKGRRRIRKRMCPPVLCCPDISESAEAALDMEG